MMSAPFQPAFAADPMRENILAYLEAAPIGDLRLAASLVVAMRRHRDEKPDAAARFADAVVDHASLSAREMLQSALWLTRTTYAPPPGWTRTQWRDARGDGR